MYFIDVLRFPCVSTRTRCQGECLAKRSLRLRFDELPALDDSVQDMRGHARSAISGQVDAGAHLTDARLPDPELQHHGGIPLRLPIHWGAVTLYYPRSGCSKEKLFAHSVSFKLNLIFRVEQVKIRPRHREYSTDSTNSRAAQLQIHTRHPLALLPTDHLHHNMSLEVCFRDPRDYRSKPGAKAAILQEVRREVEALGFGRNGRMRALIRYVPGAPAPYFVTDQRPQWASTRRWNQPNGGLPLHGFGLRDSNRWAGGLDPHDSCLP